jgi:ribonuclease D
MARLDALYVSTRAKLAEVVEVVRASDVVGMDTEFIGEGTYEPVLCLVQLTTPGALWIVDPFSVGSMAELWEALTAPERELIVLAAREEIRFCLRYARRAPARLFDVQLAAGLVGYGYPLSHTNLVRAALGVDVAGGETFTDWKQRPLSTRQLEYAADDVRHLLALRTRLLEQASALGRTAWLEEECRAYVERIAESEQEERWWKVSGSGNLSRRELAILRELWRWRDQVAREDNHPPRRVMRDELLVEIAKRKPASTSDLYALRGMDRGAARTSGVDIIAAVRRGLQLPDTELPRLLRRDDPPQVSVLTQLLSVAVAGLSEQHQVDPALLATTADIQDFVRWHLAGASAEESPAILTGWRGEILGGPLSELLQGRRQIRVGDIRKENPLVFE